MHPDFRSCLRLALLISFLAAQAPAASKAERIGPPAAAVSDALRQSVEEKGYRVTLDDGWTAEFWFAKQLKTETRNVPGALYPELADGEFVGLVNLPQGMSDFRGQSIPPGVYTLRYQSLPQDGNHMGVTPNPDFLLASPASADARPEQNYPYRKLVALSAKSTGANHPAVIALESAAAPGAVVKNDRGEMVFSVSVPTTTGAAEQLGIVVRGSAGQ
ncbi:MAG TPA: hypothetical protein VL240_00915 [Candidatus Binatia bacterium]|nr:hypothetical protein [Candidatus Binatia bacterium]